MSDEADPVRWLLMQAVPEVASGVVEIKAIAHERWKSKIAVHSCDQNVDPVRACLEFAKEQGQKGHSIDLIRWDERVETFISEAMAPAEIAEVVVDHSLRRAIVTLAKDHAWLASGRGARNCRLASQLFGYEIEIVSPNL